MGALSQERPRHTVPPAPLLRRHLPRLLELGPEVAERVAQLHDLRIVQLELCVAADVMACIAALRLRYQANDLLLPRLEGV